MDNNTVNSGTRLFYQVTPSGWTNPRSTIKLVPVQKLPGKSMETFTISPVTQPKASAVKIINNNLHLLPQTSHPKMFLTTSPEQSSTNTFIQGVKFSPAPKPPTIVNPLTLLHSIPSKAPNSQILSNLKALSSKASPVFFTSCVTNKNPTANTTLAKLTPTVKSNFIKTFCKSATNFSLNKQQTLVPHSSKRSNSPMKWVVEECGPVPIASTLTPIISPSVASEVLDVVAKREQLKKKSDAKVVRDDATNEKSQYSVVMCHDKVFFHVKNNATEPTGHTEEEKSELIDLCDEEDDDVLDMTEKAGVSGGDEENVQFVAYIPPSKSSLGKDRAEKPKQTLHTTEKMFHGEKSCTKRHVRPDSSNTSHTNTELGASHRTRHERNSENIKNSTSPSPALCPAADRKLKQMFGITSEVRIRLCRIISHTHVPSLDYTEPIEEDFLCSLDTPHSKNCPDAPLGSSSRVSRTRKRTKCPCCSPAALHRRHSQKRRSKPGEGERRGTARKQLKLQPNLATAAWDSMVRAERRRSEELQISQQIQILRETLRLKEIALERLKNEKN